VEADSLDEALALWGVQGDLYGYLLDDELGVLIDELQTDRVLVILDNCHAGSGTRGGEVLTWQELGRGLSAPPAFAGRGPMAAAVHDRRLLETTLAGALERPSEVLSKPGRRTREPVLLAASDDSETALGIGLKLDDGRVIQVGLFTIALYQTLVNAPRSPTFQSLHETVAPIVAQSALKVSGKPQTTRVSGVPGGQTVVRFLGPVRP
jgi:hypothetical protein